MLEYKSLALRVPGERIVLCRVVHGLLLHGAVLRKDAAQGLWIAMTVVMAVEQLGGSGS